MENTRIESSVACISCPLWSLCRNAALQAQNPQTKISTSPNLPNHPTNPDNKLPPNLKQP